MRDLFCVLTILTLSTVDVWGQTDKENEDIIIDPVEYSASFPGGLDSLKSFIKKNLTPLVLISCDLKKGIKTMDFDKFTIEVPKAWKKKKLWIDDSYVGRIVMESGDMAVFDLGLYSNDLEDIDSAMHDIEWRFIDGLRAKFVTARGLNGYTGICIDSL